MCKLLNISDQIAFLDRCSDRNGCMGLLCLRVRVCKRGQMRLIKMLTVLITYAKQQAADKTAQMLAN